MPQPVMQQRVCFLETAGEDYILEMVSNGLYLSAIAEKIDPGNKVGITKSTLSQWLQGKLKRNIPLKREGEAAADPNAETKEHAEERGKKYSEAREQWAESVVENAGQKLMNEDDGKMAQLRKAQAEFAFRIAGIFDKRYKDAGNQTLVAVQVNMSSDEHLSALMRRRVKTFAVPGMPGALGATLVLDAEKLDDGTAAAYLPAAAPGDSA